MHSVLQEIIRWYVIKITIVNRAHLAKNVWKWLISGNYAVQDLYYS